MKTITDGGTVRKLWLADRGAFRDHLLRLDPISRHQRFAMGASDDFVIRYAETSFNLDTLIHGWFVNDRLVGAGELRGLPSDSPIPPRFSMLWAQIVEPNLLLGEKGRVFLWIQTLDEENYPIGQPRAYQLPYSDDLNVKVSDAMAQISQGVDVQGTVETDAPAPDETAEELALDIELGASEMNPGGSSGVGERIFQFDPSMLTFGIGEAPVTPGKAP